MKSFLVSFIFFCCTSCNKQTCEYYSNKAEILFQQRKYDKAVVCYSKAIDCCSSKIELYYFRAESYLCLKNYYLALRDINYVINSDFNYQINNIQLAFEDVNRALMTDSLNTESLLHRARLYTALENDSLSKNDLKKIKQITAKRYSNYNFIQKPSKSTHSRKSTHSGLVFRLLGILLKAVKKR